MDKQMLDELRGAVTDMGAVIEALCLSMADEDVYRRVSDRLWGMQSHIERANALASKEKQG